MYKFTAALGASLVLASCASQQLETRDQWLAETQRIYRDRDAEQVIRAAEAVLKNADPDDISFAHTTDGFTARRRWLVYVVIASAAGTNVYEFKAVPTPEGTKATIRIDSQGQNSDGNRLDGPVSVLASYRLFFNWLEYALGKGGNWITCERAEAELKIANAGMAPGLCAPGIMSGGQPPVPPKPEWSRPSSSAPRPPVHSRELLKPSSSAAARSKDAGRL